MTGKDLDAVMEIEEKSFSSPWSRGMFLTELENNPFSTVLVARASDRSMRSSITGYCCFWLIFGEIHIMNLAVHPDWRRKGIAARLVAETLAKGAREQIQKVHLEVRRSNDPARRLYEKFGFKVIALRPGYYAQPREDAMLMAIDLAAQDSPHRWRAG